MGQPKRKQSKQRSRNRRSSSQNKYKLPEFSRDPADGTVFKPHHVNPNNGMYRGRQVIEIKD